MRYWDWRSRLCICNTRFIEPSDSCRIRILISLIILILSQPFQESTLKQSINPPLAINLRPHTRLSKPRGNSPKQDIKFLHHLIHVVIEWIFAIHRIQIGRRQRPLHIRRAQDGEIFSKLRPETIQLLARLEGVVTPDAVSIVVQRETVLRGVDEGSTVVGPFVEPLFGAEVAEAGVSICFSG